MKSMKWTHSHSDPRTSAQTETEIYTGKKITIFQLGSKGKKGEKVEKEITDTRNLVVRSAFAPSSNNV